MSRGRPFMLKASLNFFLVAIFFKSVLGCTFSIRHRQRGENLRTIISCTRELRKFVVNVNNDYRRLELRLPAVVHEACSNEEYLSVHPSVPLFVRLSFPVWKLNKNRKLWCQCTRSSDCFILCLLLLPF